MPTTPLTADRPVAGAAQNPSNGLPLLKKVMCILNTDECLNTDEFREDDLLSSLPNNPESYYVANRWYSKYLKDVNENFIYRNLYFRTIMPIWWSWIGKDKRIKLYSLWKRINWVVHYAERYYKEKYKVYEGTDEEQARRNALLKAEKSLLESAVDGCIKQEFQKHEFYTDRRLPHITTIIEPVKLRSDGNNLYAESNGNDLQIIHDSIPGSLKGLFITSTDNNEINRNTKTKAKITELKEKIDNLTAGITEKKEETDRLEECIEKETGMVRNAGRAI